MSGRTPQQELSALLETLEQFAARIAPFDPGNAAALSLQVAALGQFTLADPPPLLTPQQARVLVYVRRYIAAFGAAPTRKEISQAFSFASPNAAQEHLRALERKGALTLTGDPRGIRLNKRSFPITNLIEGSTP